MFWATSSGGKPVCLKVKTLLHFHSGFCKSLATECISYNSQQPLTVGLISYLGSEVYFLLARFQSEMTFSPCQKGHHSNFFEWCRHPRDSPLILQVSMSLMYWPGAQLDMQLDTWFWQPHLLTIPASTLSHSSLAQSNYMCTRFWNACCLFENFWEDHSRNA